MMADAAGASESEAPGSFSHREHEKAAASETATMEDTCLRDAMAHRRHFSIAVDSGRNCENMGKLPGFDLLFFRFVLYYKMIM